MKITLIVDVDLSEEQEKEAVLNPNDFISNHIDIKGIERKQYNITLINTNLMSYSAYDFPRDMVDWLYGLKIYRLENVSDFTYAQIKGTQIKNIKRDINSHNFREFMPKLINTMKERNLKFKDIGIDDLLSFRELELSKRTINCLEYNGIFYMQDIAFFTRDDISHIRNMGEKTQRELEEVMNKYGMSYKE